MQAESGGNPLHVYRESWGENSVGLYQLSPSDSTRYKDCPNSEAELKDGAKNEKCKDSIVRTLRLKYPNENYSQVLGRYWSTLRTPKDWPSARTAPFQSFKYYAAKKGCVL